MKNSNKCFYCSDGLVDDFVTNYRPLKADEHMDSMLTLKCEVCNGTGHRPIPESTPKNWPTVGWR